MHFGLSQNSGDESPMPRDEELEISSPEDNWSQGYSDINSSIYEALDSQDRPDLDYFKQARLEKVKEEENEDSISESDFQFEMIEDKNKHQEE